MTMTMVIDDSDLDGLPPETRELRLKIRRELENKYPPIGETDADRRLRERYERKRAEFLERQRAPQQAVVAKQQAREAERQGRDWANWVTSQIVEAEHAICAEVGNGFAQIAIQANAELDEETRRLRKAMRAELETKTACRGRSDDQSRRSARLL
jgi:hypothetical protein